MYFQSAVLPFSHNSNGVNKEYSLHDTGVRIAVSYPTENGLEAKKKQLFLFYDSILLGHWLLYQSSNIS